MSKQLLSVPFCLHQALGTLGAVLSCLLMLLSCAPAPAPLHGDDLGKMPAPNFVLSTPDGNVAALSDWRGQVVVLTFVYTQCTDICPLIAHKLSEVHSRLGNEANRVKFVAISTAPEADTPISIAKFSREQGMLDKWTFLSGSRTELVHVWKDYFIDVESGTRTLVSVVHQSRVILIDAEGKQRVNYTPDFAPKDLIEDLNVVLAQG